MKGLELGEKFYEQYGKKMIDDNFANLAPYIATGLCGSGSECMGFDDDVSCDHDFEPGFCIFLPDESLVSSRDEFLLERAYAKLPKVFLGYKRSAISPVGGNRHGVIRLERFLEEKTGSKDANLNTSDWFHVSEQFLLEVTDGKIFADNYGLISDVRQRLSYLPDDVRIKKLAGNLLIMAQSGQYNYQRCIKRGDTGAAQLTISEFANALLKTVFLLNKKYIPYYKWVFKALKSLDILSHLADDIEYIISSPNGEKDALLKAQIIEKISQCIIDELKKQDLTRAGCNNLESHAYSVNDRIKDPNIRNLHILYAI